MIRQGDVMLVPVGDLPPTAVEVPADEHEGVVLLRGELSNHRHALPYGGAVMYADNETGHRFVAVKEPTKLQQLDDQNQLTGDHATLDVPAGTYKIEEQREALGDRAVYHND